MTDICAASEYKCSNFEWRFDSMTGIQKKVIVPFHHYFAHNEPKMTVHLHCNVTNASFLVLLQANWVNFQRLL
jgi:hypothetical protein